MEQHSTSTVDEVAHELAHSKYFTKLDARCGYWAVVLYSKSSLLTTFKIPYAKYHFLKLPFGLACSQDVFQKRKDQILEACECCIGIADDIPIHGCTEAKHAQPQETQVKTPKVKFFGCLYDQS